MKIKKCIICFLLSLMFVSCSDNTSDIISDKNDNKLESSMNKIESIKVDKFSELLDTGDYVLIDIRSPQELIESWFIMWTKNIDYYSHNFSDTLNKLDKDENYLIYCRSWARSASALNIMKELWFKNVKDLKWWIWSWLNSWKQLIK